MLFMKIEVFVDLKPPSLPHYAPGSENGPPANEMFLRRGYVSVNQSRGTYIEAPPFCAFVNKVFPKNFKKERSGGF